MLENRQRPVRAGDRAPVPGRSAQSPDYAAARYQLALAYERAGNAPKAREQLEVYNQRFRAQKARDIGVRGSKE